MRTAAKEKFYGVVNMTAETSVEFRIRLSDVGAEATMWSIADVD